MVSIAISGHRPQAYRPVTLDGVGTLEIEITSPRFADRLKDDELLGHPNTPPGEWVAHRLKTAVIGWRDLTDENGDTIPFVWEALEALCEQYPDAFSQIVRHAHEAYRGITPGAAKNSAGPVSPPSEVAA